MTSDEWLVFGSLRLVAQLCRVVNLMREVCRSIPLEGSYFSKFINIYFFLPFGLFIAFLELILGDLLLVVA